MGKTQLTVKTVFSGRAGGCRGSGLNPPTGNCYVWLSCSSLILPNLFILLTVTGLGLAERWTRLGLLVAMVSAVLLYLVSTPVVAECLFGFVVGLADAMPSFASDAPPGAIIVLASDYRQGQHYTVGPLTLERRAEAARQERHLGLPVLVSGGRPGADDSFAGMMSAALQADFGVPCDGGGTVRGHTFEKALRGDLAAGARAICAPGHE